ncbi:MAG: serine/threonine protein kinase [Candidatus Bruticola sp.]
MARHNKGELIDNRYRVLDYLGEGAQSCVYLVSDARRPLANWALKQLRLNDIPPEERQTTIDMFHRESQILQQLHHQALPKLIDCATPAGEAPYIVMERVIGRPLDEVLDGRSSPLRLEEALPIALQLTHLLQALHSQDPPIIYRDLKPSNLILSPSGMIRLIDFGIARFRTAKSLKDTQELGTPGYCAPEQYRGHSTIQSDIYSLGVTLFYMLTLKDPQSMNFQFPALNTLVPNVPSNLTELLTQCLDIDTTKRPKSAAELRSQLFQILKKYQAQATKGTAPLELGLINLSHHLTMLES